MECNDVVDDCTCISSHVMCKTYHERVSWIENKMDLEKTKQYQQIEVTMTPQRD